MDHEAPTKLDVSALGSSFVALTGFGDSPGQCVGRSVGAFIVPGPERL